MSELRGGEILLPFHRAHLRAWRADSEVKHEPVSGIGTVVVDGLKVLDPKRPIREADMRISDPPRVVESPKEADRCLSGMLSDVTRILPHAIRRCSTDRL